MKQGILFVISAPSGTGKTTLLKKVMATLPGLSFSVSHTTRKPREGERHGLDYFFVERGEFEKMIAGKAFLEWARVHDNYYGTSIAAVSAQLDEGQDVILDIDVQGADIIRKTQDIRSVQIFIAPPDMAALEKRLRGRNTEDESTIQLRLQNARTEMMAADSYDYLVVNDQLEEAAETLTSIFVAERSRARRRRGGEPLTMESCR